VRARFSYHTRSITMYSVGAYHTVIDDVTERRLCSGINRNVSLLNYYIPFSSRNSLFSEEKRAFSAYMQARDRIIIVML